MTDTTATAPGAGGNNAGIAALSRLTERLAAVTPPAAAASLAAPIPAAPRFSPAVTAALDTTAALAAEADRRARRSRSITGTLIRGFVAACAFIPYAVVALALRLVIARVFFLDGQTRVDGMPIPLHLRGFDFSFILPLQVKAESYASLLTGYLPVRVPPGLVAYLVSGGEFLLPIMLVLGFGTRFAALGLLAITAFMQIYVMPQALWTTHVYWAAILLVLLSRGAGALSLDHFIWLAKRN
jgi:putative oxidoreductase